MNKLYLFIFPFILILSGCLTAKFNNSSVYNETKKPHDLYVIVVGDEDTRKCLNYYKDYLVDTIAGSKVKVDGLYDCCVTPKTDLNIYMNGLIAKYHEHPYILTAVISKVIVGYGTSSSRTLKLNLIDIEQRKSTWSGELTADFSWFINDKNYQNVAKKLTTQTIAELKTKGIIN